MNTPIMQTLLPLVREYGSLKARKWLEGEEELAIADDDLTSFLARQDVEWDHLLTADQDCLRDAYIEAGKTEMARRLTGSYPVASSLPVSVAPAASCASPAPLVPEVVKEALEGLEGYPELLRDMREDGDDLTPSTSTELQQAIESAIEALRSYNPVPSPSVELLMEAREALNPFSELWHRSEEFRQEEKSSCEWRIKKPDLTRAHNVLVKLNAALA